MLMLINESCKGGKKKVGWIKKVEFCTYTMMCEIDRLWDVAA